MKAHRAGKLHAIRARWQKQQKALQVHYDIAKQALTDLEQRRDQLQQLRLDYRNRRSAGSSPCVNGLRTLVRYDIDISQSLSKVESQLTELLPQLEQRRTAVLQGQRRLLGLQRFQDRQSEIAAQEARRTQRRRLNQMPWRTRNGGVNEDSASH